MKTCSFSESGMPVVTQSRCVDTRRRRLAAAVGNLELLLAQGDRFTYFMGFLANEVLAKVVLVLCYVVLAMSRGLRRAGPWVDADIKELRASLGADEHWDTYGPRYPMIS